MLVCLIFSCNFGCLRVIKIIPLPRNKIFIFAPLVSYLLCMPVALNHLEIECCFGLVTQSTTWPLTEIKIATLWADKIPFADCIFAVFGVRSFLLKPLVYILLFPTFVQIKFVQQVPFGFFVTQLV